MFECSCDCMDVVGAGEIGAEDSGSREQMKANNGCRWNGAEERTERGRDDATTGLWSKLVEESSIGT